MKRNKGDWTDNLPDEVYIRLCECRSIKDDIFVLTDCLWDTYKNSNATNLKKRDAFSDIIALLTANSQIDLFNELTADECERLRNE